MSRYNYIPLIRKMIYKPVVLIERVLPKEGRINVESGIEVGPADKLGACKVVYEMVDLGKDFKPVDKKYIGTYHAKEKLIGASRGKKFEAPFNGKLEQGADSNFTFKSEERDYWLLPGVWGKVQDISHNRSVLIKTQTVDIHVPVATRNIASGELIVFPNPSELLSFQYFNSYLKSPAGKIIYVGNTVSMDIIKRAAELNVGAILAGSADKEVYEYALQNNIPLGLFSGYGDLPTPDAVYTFLNSITSRYVFFQGGKNILMIPVPLENKFKKSKKLKSILVYVKKGMKVQVFDSKVFGATGTVDSVTKSGILVKLHDSDEQVKVEPPNLLAVE